jgi:hypothetical protein
MLCKCAGLVCEQIVNRTRLLREPICIVVVFALCEWSIIKTSAPLSLMTPYRMSQISARSISLDSTFKTNPIHISQQKPKSIGDSEKIDLRGSLKINKQILNLLEMSSNYESKNLLGSFRQGL